MILRLKSALAILLGRTSLQGCYELGYIAGIVVGVRGGKVVKVKISADTELN
jgi:hypothetical protein